MVFRVQGSGRYKLRIALSPTRSATCSTGCVVEADARAVEMVVRRWLGREGKQYARPDVLALVIDKRISLAVAYEAEREGTLDGLVARATAHAAVVDLRPHVTAWYDEKRTAKKGARSASLYRAQLAVLYPAAAPFTLATFTRKDVAARLDALAVDSPTKNRYKAAVSSFAKYLVKREVLETNFVRDIEGFGENEARVVYYERDAAKRLLGALGQPLAGIAAVAAGFCAEWSAIAALTEADLDLTPGLERAHLKGTKRAWRRRWVPLVDENRWLLPYLRAARRGKLAASPLFAGVSETQALRGQRAVATALKIAAVGEDLYGQHNLHDWRHTHAVQLLRDGYGEQIAASHLGHKNTDMVRKKYGVFLPTREDYARAKPTPAARPDSTKSATSRT